MIKIFGLKFLEAIQINFALLWSKIYNYRSKKNSILYHIAKDSPTATFIQGCQYNFKLPHTMYRKLPVTGFIHFPKGL